MKSIALVASWCFEKIDNEYYCPATHYLYIRYAVSLFDKVYLVSPVKNGDIIPLGKTLVSFDNFEIIEMPHFEGYLGAQRYKKQYRKAIEELENQVDTFYCRVPDPFSWMPALYTSKPVIMHYVGDIVEATKQNINFSWLKKRILLAGYYPELKRVEKAASKSKVYTNGVHIAERLAKKRIQATPVISSTMSESDFATVLSPLQHNPFRLIYIGYLRYAKGIDTLMEVIKELKNREFSFTFDIVGGGEMYNQIATFIQTENLENHVKLHGHLDDRTQMFDLLKKNDLFFFPSLSEGSPRVVIEAMGQGLPVLSTPVGSLPGSFREDEEILFFPFKDAPTAANKIINCANNLNILNKIRTNSFTKVRNEFTIENFLGKVMLGK